MPDRYTLWQVPHGIFMMRDLMRVLQRGDTYVVQSSVAPAVGDLNA